MADPKRHALDLDGAIDVPAPHALDLEGAVDVTEPETVSTPIPVQASAMAPQGQAPRQPSPATPVPAPVSRSESFLRGAADTASLGLNDETTAALLTLGSPGQAPPQDPKGELDPNARTIGRGLHAPRDQRSAYQVERDIQRADDKAAQEANPGHYFGGQLVGAAPMAVATAGGGSAVGLGARALQGMAAAVPVSAAYGYGTSESDKPVDQFFDTLQGGMSGAITGPLANELGHQAGKIPKAVRQYITNRYGEAGLKLPKTGSAPLEAPTPNLTAAYGDRLKAGIEATENSSKGRTLRELAQRGADPKVMEEHAKNLQKNVSEIWQNADLVKWEEDIASKGRLVSKLIKNDGVDPDAVIQHADAVAQRLRIQLGELEMYVEPGTPDRTLINKLVKEVNEYQLGSPAEAKTANLDAVTAYDVAGDKFLKLDQVKREIQKALTAARSRRDSPIIAEIDELETGLREYLQNGDVWGPGSATLQEVRNRGWRERLLLENKDGSPRRLFLTDASGKGSIDPYKPMLEGDPAGLMDLVKNVDQYTSSNEIRTLREWANREAGLLEALVDHVDPDPRLVSAAKVARERAKDIQAILDERLKEAIAARKLTDIGKPVQVDPGLTRQMLESVPLAGPAIKRYNQVPDLASNAEALSHLERVLSIDPNNTAAKEALKRIFSQLGSSRTTVRPSPGILPGLTAYPGADQKR